MQAVVLVRKLAAISRAPLIERTDLDSTALIEIGKGGFWGLAPSQVSQQIQMLAIRLVE